VGTPDESLRRGDEDASRFPGTRVSAKTDDKLDLATHATQEVHEAFDREALQPIARECRYFGLVDPELASGARLGKMALRKNVVSGNRETGGAPFGFRFYKGCGQGELDGRRPGLCTPPTLPPFGGESSMDGTRGTSLRLRKSSSNSVSRNRTQLKASDAVGMSR
jgi:hypothetical protein